MEKMVAELAQILSFKDTTEVGDIVLVAAKEPQMLVYARIEKIDRDPNRREEWWHVSMTMLTLPLQKITWTLRTEQMTGQEVFTMGGEERFVKAIDFGGMSVKKKPAEKTRSKQSVLKRVK